MAQCVLGYNLVNDRIISVRIQGKSINTTFLQVYAPTAESDKEAHNDFYGKLQDTVDSIPRGDIMVIMGDFNAKVGSSNESRAMGGHGLGVRNVAGDRLLEFCEGNDLVVVNTLFPQPKRRLYTWTSPGGEHRNQFDYILVRNRWRSSILSRIQKNPDIKEPFVVKEYSEEPQILESEIRKALHDISNNKLPSCDGIPIEIMKAAGKDGIHALTILCRKIWDTGEWPRDWKKSTYIHSQERRLQRMSK